MTPAVFRRFGSGPGRHGRRARRLGAPWRQAARGAALAMLVALCGLISCDGPTSPTAAAAPDAGPAADLIAWAPDATGTTSVPVYGRCRLGAERVLWAASNGAADDHVSLTAQDGEAVLAVRVMGASGLVLQGDVTLERALKDKSYHRATGTARWAPEGLDAQVVDGTLCFSERLASGAPAEGEFSLVLAAADGSFASVSGDFRVAGAVVSTDPSAAFDADAVDVDLR